VSDSTASGSTGAASSAPAGWYSDPAGSGQLRWWDGTRWTEHVHPVPDAAAAAPGLAPATSETSPTNETDTTAPRGAGAYTWYIWAIVLLPLLSVIAFGFFDLRGYMLRSVNMSMDRTSPLAGMALLTDPGYLAMVGIGWVVYAATVVLAFLDWRALQHAAVVRPFHWAWAFVGGWVYVIGRSVVVRTRTGRRGLMPIWVLIAVVVIGIVVVVVKMVDAVSALIGTMPTAP
jgi:hypothetical protein